MGRDSDPISKHRDHLLESERIHYNWMLTSLQRFRLFFCGLVFAVLSFSLQVGFDTLSTIARILYTFAWLLLLGTGILALREAGGFTTKHSEESFNGVSTWWRYVMLGMFISGIVLLGAAKWAS